MTELSHVLVLSLLPGAGNFAGGIIAEFWRPSARLLNWALHAAAANVSIAATNTRAAMRIGWGDSVEDILEEAHRSNEDGKRSMLAFLAGFVLFTLVSIELERFVVRNESGPLALVTASRHERGSGGAASIWHREPRMVRRVECGRHLPIVRRAGKVSTAQFDVIGLG